jgi:threonine dehydrogenase-like Zn-dependent dehydrogenase
MKAVVFHGIGDIWLDDVPEPRLEEPTDAIVRLSSSAICGTDLHMIRGTLTGMQPGTILGHEGVGVVEQVGAIVRNFEPGDRVVIGSTIVCAACAYCRAGYYTQCDNATQRVWAQGINAVAVPLPLTSLGDDVAALDRTLERADGPTVLAGTRMPVPSGR